MNDWRSIETAPRDGQPVLLCTGDGALMIGEWSTEPPSLGFWRGVFVEPRAERRFPKADDPEDQEKLRYSFIITNDPPWWMPLPDQPEQDEI